MAEKIIYFVAGAQSPGYMGEDPKGDIFFRIWQFFIKHTPPEIKFKRRIFFCFLI